MELSNPIISETINNDSKNNSMDTNNVYLISVVENTEVIFDQTLTGIKWLCN